jgi:hypothetical protein
LQELIRRKTKKAQGKKEESISEVPCDVQQSDPDAKRTADSKRCEEGPSPTQS